MKRRMNVDKMMNLIRNEKIHTWFDLGIFIDRLKENNPTPTAKFDQDYSLFKKSVSRGGIAFISFGYSVDGVTIEILKYAKIFRKIFKNIPIHLIGGNFQPESFKLIDDSYKKYTIEEARSFNKWKLYKPFFFIKLERGSKEYNRLIKDFWEEVLIITEKLGRYIEKEKIELLYIVNVNSNPGNVSFALANVFVSEYLGIPVINNNHDFYWEGGNSETKRTSENLKTGPRDFFFTNSHLGEFFSQIEMLFPWESRSWMEVNINDAQSKHLIELNGINPANVIEIGTAVDVKEYMQTNKRKKINTFYQFEKILSRYQKTLIAYSPSDVVFNKLVDSSNLRPILVGYKRTQPIENFLAENIIFLQPTRIIGRKRIEISFRLIERLFGKEIFRNKFSETLNLKLTLIVTGPIATGHYGYFENLIKKFHLFLEDLPEPFRDKVFIAFLFSELDKEKFKKRFDHPVAVTDLYNIASLVLLPSETEGRGLPIIEAAASGRPIFCRRYFPEHVYANVIGEHLPEEDRLNVIEFDGKKIRNKQLDRIIKEVFHPHTAGEIFIHNKKVVEKRYSLDALNENILEICSKLYLQLRNNTLNKSQTKKYLLLYQSKIQNSGVYYNSIINQSKREYLPGFGRLSFMLMLKSLIDPSAFRKEEQLMRGRAFLFAYEILIKDPDLPYIPENKIFKFFNSIDNIFRIWDGELEIQHDHSFAYRHRNRRNYLYRKFTFQELTGLINFLYYEILRPSSFRPRVDGGIHFFTDWNLALSQLTGSDLLAIDDRNILIEKMKQNIPLGVFSGKYVKHELEFFVLQAIRSRFKLNLEEELTEEVLLKSQENKKPVYLFLREKPIRNSASAKEIIDYIENGNDNELKLLLKYGLLKIVKSKQWSVGIHLGQVGEDALKVLDLIRKEKGLLISHSRNAAMMTDIINIDRIHTGRVDDMLSASIMGIPVGSGYIQYVPAGIRATLAYPTPIQTAYDFHKAIKSGKFKKLEKEIGKEKIFEEIQKDAETKGSPVNEVLQELIQRGKGKPPGTVDCTNLNGIYDDGLPWNGVLAKTLPQREKKWKFLTLYHKTITQPVTQFIRNFENKTGEKIEIAWNGGYILNAELVGKLGLPESYIGSPLGLLISEGIVKSPPLFNKPALLVYKNGKINIRRVHVRDGIKISAGSRCVRFNSAYRNVELDGPEPIYYDLMYNGEKIYGNGRVIIRLAGNTVMEVIHTKKREKVKSIPVGLTFSFDQNIFPKDIFKLGTELKIEIESLKDVQYAVEAGPLLVENGKTVLDMEKEGWKKIHSINTQAARLDYTDMRGPKIAAAIDKEGNLMVLTINGRIRESVGATHIDMAKILANLGAEKAMGFDPGGSSTLIAGGNVINVSPYNHNYEKNEYALPPEPRAVSNAILGLLEKD